MSFICKLVNIELYRSINLNIIRKAKALKTVAEVLKLQRKVWASQNYNTRESLAGLC